jgi:hypothetical protein
MSDYWKGWSGYWRVNENVKVPSTQPRRKVSAPSMVDVRTNVREDRRSDSLKDMVEQIVKSMEKGECRMKSMEKGEYRTVTTQRGRVEGRQGQGIESTSPVKNGEDMV